MPANTEFTWAVSETGKSKPSQLVLTQQQETVRSQPSQPELELVSDPHAKETRRRFQPSQLVVGVYRVSAPQAAVQQETRRRFQPSQLVVGVYRVSAPQAAVQQETGRRFQPSQLVVGVYRIRTRPSDIHADEFKFYQCRMDAVDIIIHDEVAQVSRGRQLGPWIMAVTH